MSRRRRLRSALDGPQMAQPFRTGTGRYDPFGKSSANDRYLRMIGIGGCLAAPPLPHHLAYGSVPRRFDRVKLGRAHRFGKTERIEIAVAQRLLDRLVP